MKLNEIIAELELDVLNVKDIDKSVKISNAYSGDLLSQVLASATEGSIWFTIQSHMNIIGVAKIAQIPAIVVCENQSVAKDIISRADHEGIIILRSDQTTFVLSGRLFEFGIKGMPPDRPREKK